MVVVVVVGVIGCGCVCLCLCVCVSVCLCVSVCGRQTGSVAHTHTHTISPPPSQARAARGPGQRCRARVVGVRTPRDSRHTQRPSTVTLHRPVKGTHIHTRTNTHAQIHQCMASKTANVNRNGWHERHEKQNKQKQRHLLQLLTSHHFPPSSPPHAPPSTLFASFFFLSSLHHHTHTLPACHTPHHSRTAGQALLPFCHRRRATRRFAPVKRHQTVPPSPPTKCHWRLAPMIVTRLETTPWSC